MVTIDREGPGNYKWLVGSVVDRIGKTVHEDGAFKDPTVLLLSLDIQVAHLEQLASVFTDDDAKYEDDLDEIDAEWAALKDKKRKEIGQYQEVRRRLVRMGAVVRSLGRKGVILSRGPGQASWPGEEDEAEVLA